jgi:hypothetical protein
VQKPKIRCYCNFSNDNYGLHSLTMHDHNGNQFWFSYDTLVAFQKGFDPKVVIKNYWKNTTGKHLNAIDGGNKKSRVDFETFDRLYAEAFGD